MSKIAIPKIIHQTWKTNQVPDEWKTSPVMWKKLHPDWTYKLWTDEDNLNFIKKKYPWYLKTYLSFPYNIQRADAIRYCILYEYGGLYSDLDIEPIKKLDDLFIYEGAYLVKSINTPYSYTNSILASTPKNKFWLDVLKETMKKSEWWYVGKHITVMNTTGPAMINRVILKTPFVIHTLPHTFLFSCSICDKMPCQNNSARLRMLKGQSWNEIDSLIFNFCLCKWKYILFVIVLLFVIVIFRNQKRQFKKR